MDILQFAWSWTNPWTAGLYISLTLVAWYAILGVQYGFNSGQLGRGRWWVFECFWEDFLMSIPGGSKRKGNNIRERVESCPPPHGGSFFSFSVEKSWTYDELRKTGAYEECGRAMFSSAFSFWFYTVFCCLAVAAIIGPYVIVFYTLIAIPCALIAMALSRSFQWSPLQR